MNSVHFTRTNTYLIRINFSLNLFLSYDIYASVQVKISSTLEAINYDNVTNPLVTIIEMRELNECAKR